MNDLAWLERRKDLPKEPTMAEIKQQRDMLLNFYKAWEHLHSIPHDPRNREKSERAAQALVDAAHPLRVLGVQNAD